MITLEELREKEAVLAQMAREDGESLVSTTELRLSQGKYARLKLEYLEKVNPVQIMIWEEFPWEQIQYLSRVQQQALQMKQLMMKQLITKRGITEELKLRNPMLWAQKMTTAQSEVEEVKKSEDTAKGVIKDEQEKKFSVEDYCRKYATGEIIPEYEAESSM